MKRTAIAASAALSLGLAFAACGDDDDNGGGASSEAKTVAFEISGTEKERTLTGPDTVEAGLANITFKNGAKGEVGVQLVRIEGDHTAAQALKVAEAWGDKGKPLPEWVLLEGGVATTAAGASGSATEILEPGKYLAVEIDTNAQHEFEVTGEAGGDLPTTSGTLTARDYSFEGKSLESGKVKVEFDNAGKQPHFAVGAPLKAGTTIAEAKKFFSEEESGGPPPIEEKDSFSTPIIDGGKKQLVELELKPGKYAVLCFIPDRAGGPPHVAKGMVSQVEIQ